jgi:hypothetical protein
MGCFRIVSNINDASTVEAATKLAEISFAISTSATSTMLTVLVAELFTSSFMVIENLLFFFNYARLKFDHVEHQNFHPRQVQGAQPVAAANPPVGKKMRDWNY